MKETIIHSESIFKLMHPRHVILVTCINPETKKANIITLAWSTPLSNDPPLMGIAISPKNYSHNLVAESKEFVINIPTEEIFKETLVCGRISGRDFDKFSISGLTPKQSKMVKSPIISECPVHIECKVVNQISTGNHTFFVGKALVAYANKEAFNGIILNNNIVKTLHAFGGRRDPFTTTSNVSLTKEYSKLEKDFDSLTLYIA